MEVREDGGGEGGPRSSAASRRILLFSLSRSFPPSLRLDSGPFRPPSSVPSSPPFSAALARWRKRGTFRNSSSLPSAIAVGRGGNWPALGETPGLTRRRTRVNTRCINDAATHPSVQSPTLMSPCKYSSSLQEAPPRKTTAQRACRAGGSRTLPRNRQVPPL